jgi:hypothetical protein
MAGTKAHVLALTVLTGADVDTVTVVEAVNSALNEPPCVWGDWAVGSAEPSDTTLADERTAWGEPLPGTPDDDADEALGHHRRPTSAEPRPHNRSRTR